MTNVFFRQTRNHIEWKVARKRKDDISTVDEHLICYVMLVYHMHTLTS